MQWYFLALSSLFLFSLSSIFQRRLLSKTSLNPVIYGFTFQVLVGILAIPIFFYKPGTINGDLTTWFYILLASVFYAFSNFLLFWGIKFLEISQVSIIGSTKSFWVLIGSAIILSETVTSTKILGVALIILALLVIIVKGVKVKPSKGQLFILGATVFSAAAYVLDGLILKDFSASFYLIISSLATGFGTLAISPKSASKIKELFNKSVLTWTIFISAIFSLAVYMLYYSYQVGGTISSLIPITQTATILTVVLAAIFLKETSNLPRKIVAAIISFIGILLLR